MFCLNNNLSFLSTIFIFLFVLFISSPATSVPVSPPPTIVILFTLFSSSWISFASFTVLSTKIFFDFWERFFTWAPEQTTK